MKTEEFIGFGMDDRKMKTKELNEEIERLKKKFWKKYTLLFNNNSEAFELMREIGVAQGEYTERVRIKEGIEKFDFAQYSDMGMADGNQKLLKQELLKVLEEK